MKTSVEALRDRYNRLLRNGKNSDGQGVLRKLARAIRAAEKESK